jgi:hypothetical protein
MAVKMAENNDLIPKEDEYEKITDEARAKSEAVREMFDFPREKLSQRTRLNEKEIHTFGLMQSLMDILHQSPADDRLFPEIWLDNIMLMKISLRGDGRKEGMSIFQMQSEEKEIDEALKP